jgi:hypothetical protein
VGYLWDTTRALTEGADRQAALNQPDYYLAEVHFSPER